MQAPQLLQFILMAALSPHTLARAIADHSDDPASLVARDIPYNLGEPYPQVSDGYPVPLQQQAGPAVTSPPRTTGAAPGLPVSYPPPPPGSPPGSAPPPATPSSRWYNRLPFMRSPLPNGDCGSPSSSGIHGRDVGHGEETSALDRRGSPGRWRHNGYTFRQRCPVW